MQAFRAIMNRQPNTSATPPNNLDQEPNRTRETFTKFIEDANGMIKRQLIHQTERNTYADFVARNTFHDPIYRDATPHDIDSEDEDDATIDLDSLLGEGHVDIDLYTHREVNKAALAVLPFPVIEQDEGMAEVIQKWIAMTMQVPGAFPEVDSEGEGGGDSDAFTEEDIEHSSSDHVAEKDDETNASIISAEEMPEVHGKEGLMESLQLYAEIIGNVVLDLLLLGAGLVVILELGMVMGYLFASF